MGILGLLFGTSGIGSILSGLLGGMKGGGGGILGSLFGAGGGSAGGSGLGSIVSGMMGAAGSGGFLGGALGQQAAGLMKHQVEGNAAIDLHVRHDRLPNVKASVSGLFKDLNITHHTGRQDQYA